MRWKLRGSAPLLLLFLILGGCVGPPADEPARRAPRLVELDGPAIDARVDSIRSEYHESIGISIWLGPGDELAWYGRDPNVPRPAASSIKTAFLVELFSAYSQALDEPSEGVGVVLNDPEHPAITHFDETTQQTIREHLGDASVRDIGWTMIRSTDDVPNEVYNAAANVTTALVGGPDGLTGRLRARDPTFSGLAVRRYMLAERDVTGDNEATAGALGAVLQRISTAQLRGVRPETTDAIKEILLLEEEDDGAHYYKGGSLNSDPLSRVASGYWENDDGIIVYVVMAERSNPGALEREAAGDNLRELVEKLRDAILEAARDGLANPVEPDTP